MKKEMPMWLACIIVIIFVGVTFWGRVHESAKKEAREASITTFADCAKYYPVMESYPEQCTTPDGKHFVNPDQYGEEFPPQVLEENAPVGNAQVQ